MNKLRLLSLLSVLLLTMTIAAQIPSINVKGSKQDVYLQSLDIRIEVTGNIASTKFLMTFKNRTNRVLEGELTFPLPEGITASSYALDINGKMREAVPVEKMKATQIFEEIEQRQVDPGLLERVEGNNFRTRIYPIPENGTRTVSIGYEEELSVKNKALQYKLPTDYSDVIENFSVKATVRESLAKPEIQSGSSGEIVFDKVGNNYVSLFERKNFRPSRLLEFSLPIKEEIPQIVIQSA